MNSQKTGIMSEGVFINPETGKETRVLSGKYKRNNSDVLFFIDAKGKHQIIKIGDLIDKWVRV